jgi:FAD:protein FMN transferase
MSWRLIVLIAGVVVPRVAWTAPVTEVHYVMGTYFRVTAVAGDAARIRRSMRECFARTRSFEELFSRFDRSSELSRINASAEPVVGVSSEMAALLHRAQELTAITGGAFDVTVGALTALWRTANEWPAAATIEAMRVATGAGNLQVVDATLVRRPGVSVDLDGIAKGWAVDACVAALRAAGISPALLTLGESSVYALGAPPGTRGWEIALRGLDPDTTVGTLRLRDQSMSVSSTFGRARAISGRRIGHIVDPRSGQPLTSPALAVVVAASATDAEALSKAVLIREASQLAALASQGPGGPIDGALLIRPEGVRRAGTVDFTMLPNARRIPAAAEPLR